VVLVVSLGFVIIRIKAITNIAIKIITKTIKIKPPSPVLLLSMLTTI